MMRRIIFALIFLFTCFTSTILAQTNPGTFSMNANLGFILVSSILFSVLVIGAAIVLSYALSLPQVRSSAYTELGQVVFNVVIAATLFALFSSATSGVFSDFLTGFRGVALNTNSVSGSIFDISVLNSDSIINSQYKDMEDLLSNLFYLQHALGLYESWGLSCSMFNISVSLSPCGAVSFFRFPLGHAITAVQTAMADLKAHEALIRFGWNFALPLLCPLGLFLRTFKVSRSIGALLIATGAGFGFVFPCVTIFWHYWIIIPFEQTNSSPVNYLSMASNSGQIISDFDLAAGGLARDRDRTAQRNHVKSICGKDFGPRWIGFLENLTYNLFNQPVFEHIIFKTIFSIGMSTIASLIVTVGFIQQAAHYLGSDVDVSALSRIS